LGALEFRTAVNLLRQHSSTSLSVLETSPITPYAAGHYPPILTGQGHSHAQEEPEGEEAESSREVVPLDERHIGPTLSQHESSQSHARRLAKSPTRLSLQSVDEENQISSPTASVPLSVIPEVDVLHPSKRQRAGSAFLRGWNILFPTLHHFTQKSILGMIAALFAVPAVFCLTITLPVVVTPRGDDENVEEGKHDEVPDASVPQLGTLINLEEDGEEHPLVADEIEEESKGLDFNKWLMAVQCVCGPLFCVSVLFSTF
jgi:solute carrier family 24 (sodium/potassium/calcium exchanger), member 6